jgi:hypothetical protein
MARLVVRCTAVRSWRRMSVRGTPDVDDSDKALSRSLMRGTELDESPPACCRRGGKVGVGEIGRTLWH